MFIQLDKKLIENLPNDKIEITHNKQPIKMQAFLGFLTVPVEIAKGFLGEDMGWTRRENKELKLIITGGCVAGVEFLDRLEYGHKLQNPYNNFVNPFYLWNILSGDGKAFFLHYYRAEIAEIVQAADKEIVVAERKLAKAKSQKMAISSELLNLEGHVKNES